MPKAVKDSEIIISKTQKIALIILLFVVSFAIIGGDKLFAGYLPPGADARAHIFRTLYFYTGMANGDYVPIQYNGYAFLAGYGTFTYAVSYALFRILLAFSLNAISSSVYVFGIEWILTPVLLGYAAAELIQEARKFPFYVYALFALTITLAPTIYINLLVQQSLPYLISFAFSLLSLKYVLRLRKNPADNKALLLVFLFSALSIYTENFGYVFTFVNLLFLLPDYRTVVKLSALLAVSTSFSWIQLIEVSNFSSPLSTVVGGFFFEYACALALFFVYTLAKMLSFRDIKRDVFYQIAFIELVLVGLSLSALNQSVNFGPLNGVLLNLMPDRILYANFIVFILMSFISSVGRSKALAFWILFFTSIVSFLVVFGLSALLIPYNFQMPSINSMATLSGRHVLVPSPAIYSFNSSSVFAPLLNYSTTTGAYSQGDPSFYYLTAYYEWMSSFVDSSPSYINAMQLSGSNAIVLSSNMSLYRGNATFQGYVNGYALYSLNTSIADSVTPIEVLSNNGTSALLFSLYVNFLAYNGFSYVFTTQPVGNFSSDYIVLPGYNGSVPAAGNGKVIRVVNSSYSRFEEVNSTSYVLYTPALNQAAAIFPHGSYYIGYYINRSSEQLPQSSIGNATFVGNSIKYAFNTTYTPLGSEVYPNGYYVDGSGLPVLLKVSYYPYFTTSSGAAYTYDMNRLILLPPESGVRLTWGLPFYLASAVASAIGMVFSFIYLGTHRSKRRKIRSRRV